MKSFLATRLAELVALEKRYTASIAANSFSHAAVRLAIKDTRRLISNQSAR